MALFDKILRMGEGRTLRRFEALAREVVGLEDEFAALSDDELKAKTEEFREALREGATVDEILVPAFATVREAAWRVLGQKPYPVQIVGGIALHRGNIAEMKTGEGKTLVATMPSYLNALTGKGVHVVTVNDYLASYQSELMGRVYRFLGMSVGCIINGQNPQVRRVQYEADITYGTNNEFGFDYLRDNMVQRVEDLVQREHHYAIVDEVDSILIDEARTPLIISGPAMGEADAAYQKFAVCVEELERDVDYEVDEKKRTVAILEPGIDKVEDFFSSGALYTLENTPMVGFLNNALKAKELFKRDRDYIIRDREVVIVDEHTGRTMEGRRYSEGLHQAIEAKERVPVKAENQTLATITLQNYFRLYDKLAGMTGTAETEAAEFMSTFKLGVVPIPTNRPMQRIDQVDLVYKTREAKLRAIVNDIEERHETGQPILVGTTDVAKSEELSALLKARKIPHSVLNAKEHAREAQIVFEAGRLGAVTIATNMAGRGTDIMLGGNPEHIADLELRHRKDHPLDPEADADEWREAYPIALEAAKAQVADEHEKVKEAGGLYVLGTERHDSRRIDNQLRGRSGRQGDPGESRFYLSLEDPLLMKFAGPIVSRIMSSAAYPEDMPLEHKAVAKAIASAQHQVEALHFETRKNVLKYDDVMTDQRNLVYDQRRRVLDRDLDLDELIPDFMGKTVQDLIADTCQGPSETWNLENLWATARQIYPVKVDREALLESTGGQIGMVEDDLVVAFSDDLQAAYDAMYSQMAENPIAQSQLGEQPVEEMERRVLLQTVDRLWQGHLYEMDYLREGIGLRAMGQRDPLVEYSSEGAQMFMAMMARVREETIADIFKTAENFERALRARLEAEEKQREEAAEAAQHAREEAADERLAQALAAAPSVMGDTGHASRSKVLGRSAAGGDGSSGGLTRRERRQKSKKKGSGGATKKSKRR